jgi:hypothetical protein
MQKGRKILLGLCDVFRPCVLAVTGILNLKFQISKLVH